MNWLETLDAGGVVLIDGGTGTELQRRGAPMDDASWCGAAMHTHEALVQEVHADYIRGGAEVVITNTFGTTRLMLEAAGLGDHVASINRRAVQIARRAVGSTGREVAVAGSISAMPGHFDRSSYPGPEAELEGYREVAEVFKSCGVDLIALEMMEETVHAPLAVQAALETGLPVWLGVSCRLDEESGRIVSFQRDFLPFEEVLDVLIPLGPTVVNLMHSEIRSIRAAIEMVRERWDGPIGVYPESGHFQMPDWQFVDVISPEDLASEAEGWLDAGVTLLGGCCGTGPEHVGALAGVIAARG